MLTVEADVEQTVVVVAAINVNDSAVVEVKSIKSEGFVGALDTVEE